MNNQTKNNRILSKILPVFLLVSISLSSWSINGMDSIGKAIDKLTNIRLSEAAPAVLGIALAAMVAKALYNKSKAKVISLNSAAANGFLDVVRALLAAGANVEAKDHNGRTVLFYAASMGHLDIVRELLAAGADVEAKNNYGDTVLFYAADVGLLDIVRELIAAGAEIPEAYRTHHLILAIPEKLRNKPTIVRALTSGYSKQIEKVFGDLEMMIAAKSVNVDDLIAYKFVINFGQEIVSGFRATGIPSEEFSILDLAILNNNAPLVDSLLMAGMNHKDLTQQTLGLLKDFPMPNHEGGALESKHGDEEDAINSQEIANMIYYATMAAADHIQNMIEADLDCSTGQPTISLSYNLETIPASALRYAKANLALKNRQKAKAAAEFLAAVSVDSEQLSRRIVSVVKVPKESAMAKLRAADKAAAKAAFTAKCMRNLEMGLYGTSDWRPAGWWKTW